MGLDFFIARQPIFDSARRIFGYELLFRSGLDNFFQSSDPDQATSKVIVNSFFLMGLSELTDGKRAFINITRDILLKEYILLIPRERVVVEITETIEPDTEVVEACKKLKREGYLLAMDDFIYKEEYKPLIDITDFIKVDFLSTCEEERRSLVQRFSCRGIHFLAEKVETPNVLQEAIDTGYKYFQGFFFSKPKIFSGRDVPAYKLHYLNILREINRPELNFKALMEIIKQEVSLSFKLLRYINSAFFGLRNQITSILQALTLLGEKEIRKWVSLITLANMGEDKPEALVVQSIIRAKFSEFIAPHFGLSNRKDDLFLMGMLSLIDAILDIPISEILKEVPIAKDIKNALFGENNSLRNVYEFVLASEKGDWSVYSEILGKIRMEESTGGRLYLEAVKWGHQCFKESC